MSDRLCMYNHSVIGQVVKETVLAWKKDGLQVALAGPVPQVLQMCSDAGVTDLIGNPLCPAKRPL